MTECGLKVSDVAQRLRLGDLTSAELTAQLLAASDSSLIFADEKGAMEAAEASDVRRRNGDLVGALDGIPFAVDARFLVKDFPFLGEWGRLGGFTAPRDGSAVRRLREQGCVCLGALQTDGFLAGSREHSCTHGISRAVQKGLVPWALGMDTGGSLLEQGRDGCCCLRLGEDSVLEGGAVAVAPSLESVGVTAASVESF